MKRKALIIIMVLFPSIGFCQEQMAIKFICNSPYTVSSVVYSDDLIVGISQLPGGCEWVYPVQMGVIGETIRVIDVEPGVFARISRITVNGVVGYSAGLIELIS